MIDQAAHRQLTLGGFFLPQASSFKLSSNLNSEH